MIVVVPAETAVTNPVDETVATDGFDETHGFVVAGDAEPVNCDVPFTQADNVPVIVGNAFTVNVAVTIQPLLLVYVIVVVPADTAVTNPVDETVATDVFDETHGFVVAGDADPVNCDVAFTQADNVPVIVGNAFTVNVAVTIQPLLLVYVIVVVPADTAVTNPVDETVATDVFDETHGLVVAGDADPVNCDVPFTQADNVPVIVGNAFTVNVVVTIHPLLFVYVIVVVPAVNAVTSPVFETVATVVFEETHGFVVAGDAEPINCDVAFTHADSVPVIVGNAFTVNVAVTIQPLLFV